MNEQQIHAVLGQWYDVVVGRNGGGGGRGPRGGGGGWRQDRRWDRRGYYPYAYGGGYDPYAYGYAQPDSELYPAYDPYAYGAGYPIQPDVGGSATILPPTAPSRSCRAQRW